MKFTFVFVASLVFSTFAKEFDEIETGLDQISTRRKLEETSNCAANIVNLSLKDATLTANNLGGKGPNFEDEEEMRFAGVGEYQGVDLDLVVKIKEGNYESFGNGTRNILKVGGIIRINMMLGKYATLLFEIKKHGTQTDVVLPAFLFSVLDTDFTETAIEHYRVTGWETAQYDYFNIETDFTEVDGYCDSPSSSPSTDTCLYAKASSPGKVCGNPEDPFHLDAVTCENDDGSEFELDPSLRAFQVLFENKSSFELFMYFEPLGEVRPNRRRNAFFAFDSALSDYCPPRSECDIDDVGLSLKNARLVKNELGNGGIMEIQNVGRYQRKIVDLEISIKDTATYEVADNESNGLLCGSHYCDYGGDVGLINMVGNKKTTLVFEFKDHVDRIPVELPGFVISFLDTKEDSAVDQLVEEHYRVENWSKAQYKKADYSFFSTNDGAFCADEDARCLYSWLPDYDDTDCDHAHNLFSFGNNGCVLDRNSRSFQLHFENTASFEVDMYYRAKDNSISRSLAFSFNSDIFHNQECV